MTAARAIACALLITGAAACGSGEDEARALRTQRAEERMRQVIEALWREPGAVYDRAHPALRKRRERGSFVAQAEDLAEVMGDFEGGVRVLAVDLGRSVRGTTARVEAELSFARGVMEGNVSFLEDGEEWQPIGVELPVPPALRDDWDAARAERGAGEAPEAAAEAAEVILAELGEGGESAAAEAAAAEAARAVSAYGAFERVVAVRWTRIDAAGERARISAVLAYERTWARAEIALAPAEGREPPWRIESLRVVDPNRIGERDAQSGR